MARIWSLGLGLLLVGVALGPRRPPPDDPAALEFFEKEVRPVLATRCQACHGPTKQKGGLRLDSRAAALAGGDTGPAVVPGQAGGEPAGRGDQLRRRSSRCRRSRSSRPTRSPP